MTGIKSLLGGISNLKDTKKYYNQWSSDYELTLKKWDYKAHEKAGDILKAKIKIKPKIILDLVCETGLFGV